MFCSSRRYAWTDILISWTQVLLMQYSVKDLSSPIRENHKTCKVLVCYLLSSIPACCCCCILHEKPSPHQDVVHALLQLIARLEHENWDQRSSTCLGSIWKKERWNNVQSNGPLHYTKHTTLSLIHNVVWTSTSINAPWWCHWYAMEW